MAVGKVTVTRGGSPVQGPQESIVARWLQASQESTDLMGSISMDAAPYTPEPNPIPPINDQRIADLLACMKPLVLDDAGVLRGCRPNMDTRKTAYTWYSDGPEVQGYRELARITTFHTYGAPTFFKPTLAEVLAQIPDTYIGKTAAFTTITDGDPANCFSEGREYHKATTILYAEPITAVSILLRNTEGLYLGVSRKDDPNAFGLGGGKVDPGETPEQAAVRELLEETGLVADMATIKHAYEGWCPGGKDGVRYYTATYMAKVRGVINTTEKGRVAWVTAKQLLDGPFGTYNRAMLTHMGLLPEESDVQP